MRSAKRADRVIRIVDELLSSKRLQRPTRLKLLMLRRELQELRVERDDEKRFPAKEALRWAIIIAKIYEIADRFFD